MVGANDYSPEFIENPNLYCIDPGSTCLPAGRARDDEELVMNICLKF